MSEPTDDLDRDASSQRGDRGPRLDSWKEIAAHLGRDVRTVQRWERAEGLPVHRHQHDKTDQAFQDDRAHAAPDVAVAPAVPDRPVHVTSIPAGSTALRNRAW